MERNITHHITREREREIHEKKSEKIIVASNNNPDKETPIIQKKNTNTLSPRRHIRRRRKKNVLLKTMQAVAAKRYCIHFLYLKTPKTNTKYVTYTISITSIGFRTRIDVVRFVINNILCIILENTHLKTNLISNNLRIL